MGSCCLNKRSGVSNDNVIKVTTKSFEPRETLLVHFFILILE